jgi:hypothetical protein
VGHHTGICVSATGDVGDKHKTTSDATALNIWTIVNSSALGFLSFHGMVNSSTCLIVNPNALDDPRGSDWIGQQIGRS